MARPRWREQATTRSDCPKLGLSFPMSASFVAGNAPACAAALATLDVVRADGLCDRAAASGTRVLVEPPLCIAGDDVETLRSALRESVREVARAA